MKTNLILSALSIPVLSSIAYGVDNLFISIPLFIIIALIITSYIITILEFKEENELLEDFYEMKCIEIDKLKRLFNKGDQSQALREKLAEKRKENAILKAKIKYLNKTYEKIQNKKLKRI